MLLGQTAGLIGVMNTRVAGACALGMCLVSWLSRNVEDRSFQRIVITANLVMLSTLTVIEIHGTLTGALNWVGWLFVLADSLLVVGYAALLIKK